MDNTSNNDRVIPLEKPEVKLIVLMWKRDEYEELEKVFGEDILEFPKYVASYVRAVVFPDEKWIEKRGEAGLRIIFPILVSEEEGELEEWMYGVVEKAIQGNGVSSTFKGGVEESI